MRLHPIDVFGVDMAVLFDRASRPGGSGLKPIFNIFESAPPRVFGQVTSRGGVDLLVNGRQIFPLLAQVSFVARRVRDQVKNFPRHSTSCTKSGEIAILWAKNARFSSELPSTDIESGIPNLPSA